MLMAVTMGYYFRRVGALVFSRVEKYDREIYQQDLPNQVVAHSCFLYSTKRNEMTQRNELT